jgi:hypothetical protein
MVRSTCKPPILQHPILIRHLFNSRKLQNIKVRRNAANQNEKKKEKDPHLKPNHWSRSSRPKTQPPAPESIHRPASHACPCDPWWDRPTTWVVPPYPCARQQEKSQEIAPTLGNSDDGTLDGYGVYGGRSSIGVGCDGGQLALPDRMAQKMMAAACRGTEVLGGTMRQGASDGGDGQPVVV